MTRPGSRAVTGGGGEVGVAGAGPAGRGCSFCEVSGLSNWEKRDLSHREPPIVDSPDGGISPLCCASTKPGGAGADAGTLDAGWAETGGADTGRADGGRVDGGWVDDRADPG
ncbi:hypothetical protein [Actinoplanes sp. M2I2]|uniref:hypothetical protein n=1 Tax=Actinoplanes sp. M2I2 TaxID=1734444 RepID=UPI0020225814|nr:hypothetical protein [Actinoplanes sp. M2I2]